MDQIDKMLAKWEPTALSLFRFITGLLLFQFGVAKILKFPVIPDVTLTPSSTGAIDVAIGSRRCDRAGSWRAFAGRTVHAARRLHPCRRDGLCLFHGSCSTPRSFFPLINGGTLAILFCFACLYLSTAGGGPYQRRRDAEEVANRRWAKACLHAVPTIRGPEKSWWARFVCPATCRKRLSLTPQPATFTSSGTAASYFELCSTSDVRTLRTWGAAVRCVTKS